MRSLIHAALVASLIAAPAAAVRRTPEEQLAKLVEGRVPGKPVDCINLGPTNNESTRIDHLAMAYRQGTTWYVNRFQGGCPELNFDTIVVTRTPMSQLCRGDIANLHSAGSRMPVGSCVFDSFVPYTRPRG
jgi:hypothetical protein